MTIKIKIKITSSLKMFHINLRTTSVTEDMVNIVIELNAIDVVVVPSVTAQTLLNNKSSTIAK